MGRNAKDNSGHLSIFSSLKHLMMLLKYTFLAVQLSQFRWEEQLKYKQNSENVMKIEKKLRELWKSEVSQILIKHVTCNINMNISKLMSWCCQ